MIQRLKILQANKGQFAKGSELFNACKSNSDLRREIEVLSKYYLNRSVSGCQNCYMDAYIQLVTLNIEKIMNTEKCEYRLRNGALLRDVVNHDISLNCTNNNISNCLALYHLKTNPGCVSKFEKLPDDFENQVEAYKLPGQEVEEVELSDEEKALELAQVEAETTLVAELAELLKAKTTKTAIKAQYKEVEKVGNKNLTQRLLIELIDRAETSLEEIVEPEKPLEEIKEVSEETKEATV